MFTNRKGALFTNDKSSVPSLWKPCRFENAHHAIRRASDFCLRSIALACRILNSLAISEQSMQSPSSTLESLLSSLGTSTAGHAVFSRRGVPLLLLPKDKAIAAETMGLYRPQSAKAKIATAAVRMFCRVGLHGIALPKVSGPSDGTGILICNPCHGTRVIAVRRRANGRLEILKAASREDAEPIRREHAVLKRLIGRPGIPKSESLVERDGAVWFPMPYLRDAPRDVDPIPLLRLWETGETEPAEGNGLIRDLVPLLDEQTRAALSGRTVRRSLVHGDFAPWNWRQDEKGNLVCIDWEWAREDGFAGFDLVYSLVQQALLVKKVPETILEEYVRQAVSRIDDGSPGGRFLPIGTLVALVLAYRRSKEM